MAGDATALETYGGHLRVRVGALVFDEAEVPGAVLLVEHKALRGEGSFWTPPGGGVEFGESLPEALRREVEEETGLRVRVGPLRYTLDFVRPPLHAVSFYFQCTAEGGTLATGSDPELGNDQLIRSSGFVSFDALGGLTLYPEGFAERLPAEARSGFPSGTQHLGTLR
ncbi:MAG: NUDIX hydrolase [Bacteroidota bacterium]